MGFIVKLSQFFIEFVSKVIGLFITIIFNIIKKDIINLITSIKLGIESEKKKKYYTMILSLTSILVQIGNIIKDVRECKSVIDKITSLLSNIQKTTESVPLPLLLASRLRKGYSKTGAFLKVLTEFEELGLPTGPMPDGSPNLM
jgi:hypothetical protein